MAMDAVIPPVNADAFVNAEPAPAPVVTPAAPPWLWVWAAFFIVNLLPLYDQWRASFHQINQIRDSSAAPRRVNPVYGRLNFLLYPAVVLDVLAGGALLLGSVVFLRLADPDPKARFFALAS
jgi:hypothetical protein